MASIHNTLIDENGTTYRVVSSWWLKSVTVICLLNFVLLMLIIAGLIDNVRAVEDAMRYSDRAAQRDAATNEFLTERTELMQALWMQVCQEHQKSEAPCVIISSQWYVDPRKYPALQGDAESTGLFPPLGTR